MTVLWSRTYVYTGVSENRDLVSLNRLLGTPNFRKLPCSYSTISRQPAVLFKESKFVPPEFAEIRR